jgi:drug/metabolite transporter (DMT)-like permease
MPLSQSSTLTAAGLILIYATVIGYTDNHVRRIAEESGLWQFHAMRTAVALSLLGLLVWPFGLRLRPRNPRAVLARSALHAMAMLIYFGALAFLPVAQVAAGLFTAPIFVLLIGRIAYGRPIGPWQVVAVALGFLGVLLVLGPSALAGASLAALLPVLAGALYALGNIATREWCAGETAETLLAGFFATLGLIGVAGMVLLALLPLPVPDGAAGFVQRGAVWPSPSVMFWTFVQGAGSLLGVGLMIRAYQIADTGRVSIFEYAILPASAVWSYLLWGERLSASAVVGMALIVMAGVLCLREPARKGAPAPS